MQGHRGNIMLDDLKLLYICNDLGITIGGSSGCSIHIKEFIKALNRHAITPSLLYQKREDTLDLKAEMIEINKIPFIRNPIFNIADFVEILKNIELMNTLYEINKDNEIELIHERYSLYSHKGSEFARKNNIPFVLEINSPLLYEKDNVTFKNLAKGSMVSTLRNSNKIFTVSKELKEYFTRWVNPEKIKVVPNGVDPDFFHPETRSKIESDRFVIGFVGSMKKWHGVDKVVESAKSLKKLNNDILFLIVGDGPLKNELQKEVEENGMDEMFLFTGWIDYDEIPSYIASMDISLAPYPDLDFFYFSPIKLFEYMSMEKPVVASSLGQINHVIDDGENGFLVDPGDPFKLADKIKDLYEMKKTQREQFREVGKMARQAVIENYTWDENVKKILSLYREVIDK